MRVDATAQHLSFGLALAEYRGKVTRVALVTLQMPALALAAEVMVEPQPLGEMGLHQLVAREAQAPLTALRVLRLPTLAAEVVRATLARLALVVRAVVARGVLRDQALTDQPTQAAEVAVRISRKPLVTVAAVLSSFVLHAP